MGVDKNLCLGNFDASRRLACVAALVAIAPACYGTPRGHRSDAALGGSDGGEIGAIGDADDGTDAENGASTDGGSDTDGTMCTSGFKLCEGQCIPAPACCGPCSCDGLPRTCGPNRDEDCCATVLVMGGTFNRDNDPAYPATLDDFHLDRFEVTVGRFNLFIAAGQGLQSTAPQVGSGKNLLDPKDPGWDATWNTNLATTSQSFATNVQCGGVGTYLVGDDTLPISCVTWYEAYAFCIWDGGRLPTEAEWTYAAAGGGLADGQRVYAWSVPPSSTTLDDSYSVNSAKGPADVGSRSPKGDGKWNQADLVGNVGEWVADYVGSYPVPCYDCTNRVVSERRVIRGGDWALPALENAASRAQVVPSSREGLYGLRCARH